MVRELTYQMPFERLVKLSRSASRKAFGVSRLAMLLIFAAFIAAITVLAVFDSTLQSWQKSVGLPWFSAFVVVIAGYYAAFWVLRRFSRSQVKQRVDYDATVHMRQEDGGLRFGSDQVEYYLKWPGISQMLMEDDGVAVSHGNLFFLIPNDAFADPADRDAFVREVFAKMGEEARARSIKHVSPVIAGIAGN